jgi:hypothetical protein
MKASHVAAVGLILAGAWIGCSSPSNADPIVPGMNTNCESGFNGTVWCDGPIKPNGDWNRCFAIGEQWNGYGWTPGAQRCFLVPGGVPPALPLGQPDHHIGLS